MELAVASILFLLIAGIGAYAVLNDEEDDPNKPASKGKKYLKDVHSKRSPRRKVDDNEITPYQGFGEAKQQQRAQSRKRTQVRRKEASIWDNLAPQEHHTTLNVILAVVFVLGLIAALLASGVL